MRAGSQDGAAVTAGPGNDGRATVAVGPTAHDDRLRTIAEVAEQLAVSRRTVRRYVTNDDLPCVVLPGGQLRFRAADIAHWIAAHVASPDLLRCQTFITEELSGHAGGEGADDEWS